MHGEGGNKDPNGNSALPSGLRRTPAVSARVLVVGDVMLDRYWFGDVSRISPEAPVPIVKICSTEERLGGAANVARNAAALGARTGLVSVVGADEAGDCLTRLLEAAGIDASLHRDPALATTIKLRVIGRQQQLLRIDFETPPGREVLLSKLADLEARIPDADVVVLSDYGKGGMEHVADMIAVANAARKPVLIDPKGDDYSRYRNATLLTPNLAEFREVAGSWNSEDAFTNKAQRLRKELNLEALLITRSEQGMTLFRDGERFHEPAVAREVFDVSGAGDTVIATLAVMLAEGLSFAAAMRVANRAAGIVVGKLGTAVVSREELFGVVTPDETVASPPL